MDKRIFQYCKDSIEDRYSEMSLKQPLKNRQNKGLKDKW